MYIYCQKYHLIFYNNKYNTLSKQISTYSHSSKDINSYSDIPPNRVTVSLLYIHCANFVIGLQIGLKWCLCVIFGEILRKSALINKIHVLFDIVCVKTY